MTGERVYRRLLTIFPAAFRREYGDAMVEAFLECRRQHARRPLAFWSFVIVDLCRAASIQRASDCAAFRAGTRVRWMAACALGAALCSVLGSGATWAFTYFYHPYLEGAMFAPWAYGALLGVGLGFVQTTTVGRPLSLGRLWIVTTACWAALGVEIALALGPMGGAFGYAVVPGSVVAVGQSAVLLGQLPRSGWWVLPSAGGLSAALVIGTGAMTSALSGMQALRHDPFAGASGFHWMDAAAGLAVTAALGLLIGAVTARPVSTLLARAEGSEPC